MTDNVDYMGLVPPTDEECQEFDLYCSSNTSPFSVLGVEQFSSGQVVEYTDPSFQDFLDKRIKFAAAQKMKICPTTAQYINQSSLGSCTGASGTTGQMSAVYNSTLFGVPAIVPRLNCSVAYLKARGTWGSGLSIVKFQKIVMEFGNASVESAGEYSTRSPGKTTGFDNLQYQCWTCNLKNKEQVVKVSMAGIPVCWGSGVIPVTASNGKITKTKSGAHAQCFNGFDHGTGMVRFTNTWGRYYPGDSENQWGLWVYPDEIDRLQIFARFGAPYAIVGQEFKLKK